jgi:predicted phosphodiesterase
MIRILHLSDIHYNKHSSTEYDVDGHIRELLFKDLKNYATKQGQFYGCLVTGDIAFSGSKNEYDVAFDFFDRLRTDLNFQLGSFWIVPGNHDYNRKIANDSHTIELLLKNFRGCKEHEISNEIAKASNSEETAEILYKPLAAYNKFAEQFKCQISAKDPSWNARIPLSANPDIFLDIRGLNSVIVSSSTDTNKNDDRRMVMHLKQCQITPKENVITMSLCHHPLDWIRNREELENTLNSGANIQLFGHEHHPRVKDVDGAVLIHAGALHPERPHDAAMPSYNILEFDVHKDGENTIIKLKIICRKFDNDNQSFITVPHKKGPDHEYIYKFAGQSKPEVEVIVPSPTNKLPGVPEKAPDSLNRELAFRTLLISIHSMNFIIRMNILNELKLIETHEKEIYDNDHFIYFIEKASSIGKLGSLWDKVSKHSTVLSGIENPF